MALVKRIFGLLAICFVLLISLNTAHWFSFLQARELNQKSGIDVGNSAELPVLSSSPKESFSENATKQIPSNRSSESFSENTSKQLPSNRTSEELYVVFSTTLDMFARNSDYHYLAPLVARNWFQKGFIPVIVVVYRYKKQLDDVRRVWDIILPPEAVVVPIQVQGDAAISVAQMSRLFAASLVSNSAVSDEAYIRMSDADMMIDDPQPFLPMAANISIFNGRCCLGNNPTPSGKICNQYPMHSVGMKAGLWRSLFPIDAANNTNATSFFMHVLRDQFGYDGDVKVMHGHKGWSMDQILLGCTVDDAKQNGISLELAAGPRRRLHVGGQGRRAFYTDIHLAGFNLDHHSEWLGRQVKEGNLLDGFADAFVRYSTEWIAFHMGNTSDSRTIIQKLQ